MMIFIIVIHVIICLALIGLVLIQRGRGGGLVETLSGVESMFGTKTNAFLTRATTILSIAFFITCLVLAVLSVRQSKSLMRNVQPQSTKVPVTVPVTEPVKQATQETPKAPENAAVPQAQMPVQQEKTQETPKSQ